MEGSTEDTPCLPFVEDAMAGLEDVLLIPGISRLVSRFFDPKTVAQCQQTGLLFRDSFDVEDTVLHMRRLSFKEIAAMAKGNDRLPAPEEMRCLQALDLSDYALAAASGARPSGSMGPQVVPPRVRRTADTASALRGLSLGSADPEQGDSEGSPSITPSQEQQVKAEAQSAATGAESRGQRPSSSGATFLRPPPPSTLASAAASSPAHLRPTVISSPTPALTSASLSSMARVTRSRRSAYSTGTGRKSSRRTQAQHLAEDVDDEERNINGTSSAVDVEAACAGPCRWVEDASRCDALCAGLCKLRINELVPRRVVENLIARGTTGAAGCLELVDFCGVDKVDDALLAKIAATSISPVQSSSSTPSVSAQCQLRAIQLSKCYRVTDAGICHVAATCPLLEKLLLAGCPRVTDVGLADVMKRHNCRLTTLAITPSLGGITASGVAALFEPFTRKPAGAGAEVEVDAKTISARQAWPLRQLLLQEPRFDDAATGWKTVFEALWAYRCNACVGKPQPREEAFVLRLASPHGFTDQVVEQFLASADRSAAPKATTGPEVAAAKVKVEIAGKHDLSEACVERLQAAFLS